MSRKIEKLIVANWKMNKNVEESLEFLRGISENVCNTKHKLVICPPFTSIYAMKKESEVMNVDLGAQNCFWEGKGAFTGEISPSTLASLGVKYVIVGHSERRNYFDENNEIVNKKINQILENRIKAILCVGEDIGHREENSATEFVINQVKECLCGIKKCDVQNIIIAYEPIWAIGTGKTVSPKDADDMCLSIRKFIAKKYDEEIASKIQLLYGGSLNTENYKEFLSMENINGALIGGASLKFENIVKIISGD